MPEIELSAGTVEYEDTDGDGPVLVLLHGLAMNGSLWRGVVADLREDHHCIVPTLPLGGHCRPMHPDADLSIFGMARLVAAFLAELDLNEVTLVGNDWGGAQLLVSEGLDERVGRLVLASCEAFDNYPPGVPGSAVARAASIPGGLYLAFQSLRLRPLRRLPLTWGWMSSPENLLTPSESSCGIRHEPVLHFERFACRPSAPISCEAVQPLTAICRITRRAPRKRKELSYRESICGRSYRRHRQVAGSATGRSWPPGDRHNQVEGEARDALRTRRRADSVRRIRRRAIEDGCRAGRA